MDILSRLPLRSIAFSKCICKSWLALLETDEFAKSHLSKSTPALAVLTSKGMSSWCTSEGESSRCRVLELEDEIDAKSSHDHHYNRLTDFDFPQRVAIEGSVNGMLFLRRYFRCEDLYVWNPISREYIALRYPEETFIRGVACGYKSVMYGFGASKISGQYKVVRIMLASDCHVYTLGTGLWRRVELPGTSFEYDSFTYGSAPILNDNLHWLVLDSNIAFSIFCFDLETECFSTFFIPPTQEITCMVSLSVLRDCLCFCDSLSLKKIVIWLMKEYGDEKSWTKEYVINYSPVYCGNAYPIKVFKDGDILMVWDEEFLSYYSNKTKTIQKIGDFDGGNYRINSMLLTPSFLSLKSFPMENVISL